MFALRMVVEKSWEYNRKVDISFIDLKKAFDSVPRRRLWNVLRERYGVEERVVKAIEIMYEISRCNVRTGFENDEWFEVRTDVRQGSVLSPLLFVAYLDVVIREVKEEVGELDGDIMVYADDLACWSENEERLRRVVTCFGDKLVEFGMEMNVEKTEIMVVSREEEEEEELEIELELEIEVG